MCAAWSMSLPSSLIGLCGLALSMIALASNQASAQLTTNYLGCSVDSSSSRILSNQGPQSLSTVESCAAFAVRNFYQYFGVEFGGQCYFGGSISSAVPSNNCNIPCAANPSEICGGANAISLYSVNPPPATVAYTSYIGCLTDSTSRILNQQGPQNDATVQSCAALAISHSVPYFGLEFGGQCWYGSSILRNVSSSACLLACTGNPNQRCGGANAIDVYQVNPVLASVPYSTYAGCYADGALSFSGPQSGSTPEACALLAARNGAQYFGLENGGECFYGSLTTTSTSSSCNLACTAAPTERCGGSSALDVWHLSF